MAEGPIRVALLARAGAARDQLHRALQELGADLVAEGDPKEVDPVELHRLLPKVVLISLDPQDEDSLDRFDAVLSTEGVEVMLDDAEVTRQLEGWDLARWARHLAAKLLGRELLPPAPEGAEGLSAAGDLTPEPGMPPTPAELMAHARLEDYAAEASGLMQEVPSTPSLAEVELPAPAEVEPPAVELEMEELAIDIDLSQLEAAMNAPPPEPVATPEPEIAVPELAVELDLDAPARSFGELAADASADESFSMDLDLEGLERSLAAAGSPPPASLDEPVVELDSGGLNLDFDADQPVNFAAFSTGDEPSDLGGMDDAVAALDAQLARQAEMEKTGTFKVIQVAEEPESPAVLDLGDLPDLLPDIAAPAPVEPEPAVGGLDLPDFELPSAAPTPSAPTPPAPAPTTAPGSFGGLELSLLDEPGPAAPAPAASPAPARAPAPTPAPAKSAGMFAGMSLSLEGDAPEGAPEIIAIAAVLAGLGGPDAVKQILAALDPGLPVPVLLYQHLDNGKYDRLAEQLGKGSRLPVVLAKEGEPLRPAQVAVLPKGLVIARDGQGFRFAVDRDLSATVRELPEGSAVLVLSGADAGLMPDLIARRRQGVALYAQTPEGCFDDTAPRAAQSGGATVGAPAELAAQLGSRWKR